jgi:hypothetical protein
MFLLRSAIATHAASRGGLSGSGRIASSSLTTSTAAAAAAGSLSTLSLPPLFHRRAPRWRGNDDEDAALLADAGISTRASPKASFYDDDSWSRRLSGAIVAVLAGDSTFAATAILDAPSSKGGIDAYRDEWGVQEREDAEAVSASVTTTIEEALPDFSPLSDLSIWLISTLKRRKKMMNKHKLRKRRKKLRLKTRK